MMVLVYPIVTIYIFSGLTFLVPPGCGEKVRHFLVKKLATKTLCAFLLNHHEKNIVEVLST